MFKYVRYGFIVLCLALFCSSSYAKFIDFEVTAQPTFTDLHRGDIQSGDYTIRNNFFNAVEILSIGIEYNDDKPAAASAIVAAPTNSCVVGTSLASGATCNIRLNLQPLVLGDYNRRLKIGVNTRQAYLYGNPIIVTVTIAAPPTPTIQVADSPAPPIPQVEPVHVADPPKAVDLPTPPVHPADPPTPIIVAEQPIMVVAETAPTTMTIDSSVQVIEISQEVSSVEPPVYDTGYVVEFPTVIDMQTVAPPMEVIDEQNNQVDLAESEEPNRITNKVENSLQLLK